MCSILQDIDENSPHLNESIELQSLPPDSKDLSPDRNNQTKSNQSDTSITSKDVLADNITISSEQKSSTNIKIPKPVSTSSLMNEITDSNVIQLKYQRSFLGIERKVDSAIDVDLIIKFRNVFLNVIRISYWNQISSGRLPRGSNAAMILLNSIDVGLETSHTPGAADEDEEKDVQDYIYKSMAMAVDATTSVGRDIADTIIKYNPGTLIYNGFANIAKILHKKQSSNDNSKANEKLNTNNQIKSDNDEDDDDDIDYNDSDFNQTWKDSNIDFDDATKQFSTPTSPKLQTSSSSDSKKNSKSSDYIIEFITCCFESCFIYYYWIVKYETKRVNMSWTK
eukprot:gene19309-25170_t